MIGSVHPETLEHVEFNPLLGFRNSIVQTYDGGFALAGFTLAFALDQANIYVLKLDATGELEWAKTIGGPDEKDWAMAMIETKDSGLVIAGTTLSLGQAGGGDIYVVKLGRRGDLEWTRIIGTPGEDGAFAIVETEDGGFAISGYTKQERDQDVYVVKLDEEGNLQWSKSIGTSALEMGTSIVHTYDGGYLVVGVTYFFGEDEMDVDVYVIKLDWAGNLQWIRAIGGSEGDWALSAVQTEEGEYVIAGWTYSFGDKGDIFVVKLDQEGNLQWAKTIGGEESDYAASIVKTADGGLAIAGFSYRDEGNADAYIVKIDRYGNFQWAKAVGTDGNEDAHSLVHTHDSGFVLVGWTIPNEIILFEVYVARLDKYGNLGCADGCHVDTYGEMTDVTDKVWVGTEGIVSSVRSVISSGGVLREARDVAVKRLCP